jgi:DNA-binding XRE family transcriptional regulator
MCSPLYPYPRAFLFPVSLQNQKALSMRSNQLRSLRLSVHLSQRELAKLIGVTGPAISQAERGITQLSAEHAAKVREVVARRRELISKMLEVAVGIR